METTEIIELSRLLPYFLKHKTLWSFYDEEADVLYVHFKKPNNADHSTMTEDEIVLRYEGDELIGLTVLNASRRGI